MYLKFLAFRPSASILDLKVQGLILQQGRPKKFENFFCKGGFYHICSYSELLGIKFEGLDSLLHVTTFHLNPF